MAKIHILDEQLTNLIAAGEVVERPLQVVKELVENALDANASTIEIELKTGGIEYIRVSDNGIGMDQDDLTMAFLRHATSKISTVDQLFDIHTMGFRGEAIPSIASVSLCTCISNDGSGGNRIIVDNGQTIQCDAYPCAKGTTMIVEHLFAKVPARLKHLKNDRYELALITSTIQKMALLNLNVAFTLIHDGKTIFESDGKGSYKNTIFTIYGKDVATDLLTIDEDGFDMAIHGVLALPQYGRSNKNGITIGLNGRYIKPYGLTNVIIDATKEYFANGKYPLIVVNISMDHRLVDVNVHPGKLDVRISKQNQLDALIINALKHTLSKAGLGVTINEGIFKRIKIDQPIVSNDPSNDNGSTPSHIPVVQPSYPRMYQPSLDLSKVNEKTNYPAMADPCDHPFTHHSLFASTLVNTTPLRVIGQIHGKFIIAEDEDGLVIIDQHAAQERVHYEQFKNTMTQNIDQHAMVTPLIIPVRSDIVNGVDILNAMVEPLGLVFTPFSNQDLALHALPGWSRDIQDISFYQDIIDTVWSNHTVSIDDLIRHKIATKACKASIKFNQYLDIYQCQAVVNQLYQCDDPYACPHGRPIMLHFSDALLEKEFNR